MGKFWMVYSPQGESPPRYRHDTKRMAYDEATRLAGINPGDDFYVLKAVNRLKGVVHINEHPFDKDDADDGIPF